MGLHVKPLANMNNFQAADIESIDVGLVEYNVGMFREINGL
jgi:hypothetical protein